MLSGAGEAALHIASRTGLPKVGKDGISDHFTVFVLGVYQLQRLIAFGQRFWDLRDCASHPGCESTTGWQCQPAVAECTRLCDDITTEGEIVRWMRIMGIPQKDFLDYFHWSLAGALSLTNKTRPKNIRFSRS